MEGEEISCPECGSNYLSFTRDTKLYTCNNCKHDFTTVFISYGHDEHSDLAIKIEKDLNSEGIITWIDRSELPPGREWEIKIENGLLGTQIVVLMLTPHSVGRDDGFCLNELSMACQLGHKIVPIMVRDVVPPLSIHRIQWLDFRDWPDISEDTYKKKFAEILDILKGKLLSFDGRYSRLLNLLKPLDFGAEIEKYTKNFYGREWMFEKINKWFKSDSESKVFLLIGNPGVGKTAISAMLCHKYSDCAVYHLTKYNDARKSDALECVLSLAFQLATRLPRFAEKLLYLNLEGIRSKDAENRDLKINSVFDELIIQPLHDLPKPSGNILIIIDALDEATKEGKNELAKLIATKFDLTPQWLKLFITTRPVRKIENSLSAFNPIRLDTEEERNIQDIKGYLNLSISNLFKETNITEAVKVISNKSEGIFLYAQQVINEIKEGRLKLENIEDFPQGLKGIYQMFFERQFPNLDKYDEYQRPLLSVISAAYEPLEVELIKNILGDDSQRKFKQRIEPMGSLLEIEEGFVKPFHKSLIEWVRNEETEVEFYIDPKEGHQLILNYGWDLYNSGDPTIPNYFLAYLPLHLHVLKEQDRLSKLLTDFKYFENSNEVGVDGIFKLMKEISDVSTSNDMPIKNINLASQEGISKGDEWIAAKSAVMFSLSKRILLEINSKFKFSYGKFKSGSGCFFTVGLSSGKSEELLTIAYDKSILLHQLLNNYSYKDYHIEDKFVAGKLEKIEVDQKELMENLVEKRKDSKEKVEDYIKPLLKFILSYFKCIDGITITTCEGLPVCTLFPSKLFDNEMRYSAMTAPLLPFWEGQGSNFGFVDFEYSMIAGENILIIQLRCGTDYLMSLIIIDEIEFYRHLTQYINYFKKVADLIQTLLA